MPFVISAGTFVSGFGAGIQSVSLNLTPQIQRLYQLGSSIPFDKNITSQKSMTITKYGGQGGSISVSPSTSCADANGHSISVSAAGCGGSVGDSDLFFCTSYSYNKDVQGWGIETYSFISKPEVIGGAGATAIMIRGVAEGQTSIDGGADTGVSFTGDTIPGTNIEVSAGNPGIGRAFNIVFGEVGSVGGGTGKADGRDGTASVQIPYTPIFIA